MLKWKLMLTTLPVVLVIVVAKYLLGTVAGFRGAVDFADVSMLLTGGIFLVGFMLAGTLTDYKESEKLPGEIACCLETIEETFAQASIGRKALDLNALRKSVLATAEDVLKWIGGTVEYAAIHRSMEALGSTIGMLESAGATPLGVRAINELSSLRKAVTRIHVISKTGFLATGYAILETLTVIIIGVVLLSRFKNHLSEAILVFFVPLIYIYLVRLIRDLDDPFEHRGGATDKADEIELFPIEDYIARLKERC